MRAAPTLALVLALGCHYNPGSVGTAAGPELGEGSSGSTGRAESSSGPVDPDTTIDPTTSNDATVGPDSTSTSDDTTGGGMDDHGLLARWWVNEGIRGRMPPMLIDDMPSPLHLPITYDGEWPTFTLVQGNRGLRWNQPALNGRPVAPIIGTKIFDDLGGLTTATFELVVAVQALESQTSRFLHIGPNSDDDFVIGSANAGQLEVRWRGASSMLFSTSYDGNRQIIHVVVDTAQLVESARIRAYVNGIALTPITGTWPSSEGLPLRDSSSLTLGNRTDGQRSFAGSLQYAAIYREALEPMQIELNASALKNDDDGP